MLTHTLCDGWVNTWTVTEPGKPEHPETFATREEADQALADYLEEGCFSAEAGDLAEAPEPDDYIVSRIDYAETAFVDWQGIEIEVSCKPYWLGSLDDADDGFNTAHLEIRALRPEGGSFP
ncbi:MAG: hypothetical protein U1D66_06840 [Erythrobacter sp.]|nr:hypothetical protein [Erythrobacter sp.]